MCVVAEGEGSEVRGCGGGVRRGSGEGRARGHQGASQDDLLPPHPGAYGDPCNALKLSLFINFVDYEFIYLWGCIVRDLGFD